MPPLFCRHALNERKGPIPQKQRARRARLRRMNSTPCGTRARNLRNRSATLCPSSQGGPAQLAQIFASSAGAPFPPRAGGLARARGPRPAVCLPRRNMAVPEFAERSDPLSHETSGRHLVMLRTPVTARTGGRRGLANQVVFLGFRSLIYCTRHCSLSRSRYYSRSRL